MTKYMPTFISWLYTLFAMLLFFAPVLSYAASPTQITGVNVETNNGKTRLILTLNQKPRYTVFALDRPDRAVIDLEQTQLRTRLPSAGSASLIVKLRSGKRPQGLRLVADLNSSARLNHTLKNKESQWQLMVELTPTSQEEETTSAATSPVTVEEEPTIDSPEEIEEKIPSRKPAAKMAAVEKIERKSNNNAELKADTDDEVEAAFQKAAGLPASEKESVQKAQTLNQNNLPKESTSKNKFKDKPLHSETSFRPPSSRMRSMEATQTSSASENSVEPEVKMPARTETKVSTKPTPKPDGYTEDVLHEEIFPTPEKGLPSRYLAKRDVIIVIDAGHGGKDPGAINPNGTREKDVTLAIAQRLQRLLHEEPGIRAVLTRSNDTFIGLRPRLNVARQHKADVFVSIHADAFKTPEASGASVFALSPSGASSEAARWLAEKENTSELGEVNLEDKGAALRSVLLDLSQTATISLSVQLGSHLLSQLAKVTHVRHPKVEQARFMVLKSPDIPSILVETGFISNTEEARRLGDPIHQMRIATALKIALRRHFVQYPPPGTMLAVQHQKSMKHVVGKEETLAQIAKRYEVTPDALRKHNQLNSYRVSAGQILYIPTG